MTGVNDQLEKWVATNAVIEGDKEMHYSVVVLRDDQIARIADAVIERLRQMKTDPHLGDA